MINKSRDVTALSEPTANLNHQRAPAPTQSKLGRQPRAEANGTGPSGAGWGPEGRSCHQRHVWDQRPLGSRGRGSGQQLRACGPVPSTPGCSHPAWIKPRVKHSLFKPYLTLALTHCSVSVVHRQVFQKEFPFYNVSLNRR